MLRIGKTVSLIAMLAATASLWAADRQYNETFKLNSGGALMMDIRSGDVKVQTWDRDEVVFEAEVRGSSKFVNDFSFDFNQGSEKVEIIGDLPYRKWNWNFRSKVKVNLKIPQHCQVNIKTSGGNIAIQDVRGKSELKTSGGNLELINMDGDLVAKTSGGHIKARGISGQTYLSTSGGNIHLEDLTGDITAKTSGGDIDLNGVAGEIVAKTSGGNIEMRLAGPYQGVQASTSGGNIYCFVDGELNADLNARTSGGRVSIDFPITITGKISQSKVNGKVNGGGPPLELRSSGGNIKVLPAK